MPNPAGIGRCTDAAAKHLAVRPARRLRSCALALTVDEGQKLVGRQWLGVEPALGVVDAAGAQMRGLRFGLDPFGDDLKAERPSHLDDDVGKTGRSRAAADGLDEGLVDLERVDAEGADVGEARIAGAEIVDGDLVALLMQGGR